MFASLLLLSRQFELCGEETPFVETFQGPESYACVAECYSEVFNNTKAEDGNRYCLSASDQQYNCPAIAGYAKTYSNGTKVVMTNCTQKCDFFEERTNGSTRIQKWCVDRCTEMYAETVVGKWCLTWKLCMEQNYTKLVENRTQLCVENCGEDLLELDEPYIAEGDDGEGVIRILTRCVSSCPLPYLADRYARCVLPTLTGGLFPLEILIAMICVACVLIIIIVLLLSWRHVRRAKRTKQHSEKTSYYAKNILAASKMDKKTGKTAFREKRRVVMNI